MITMMSKYKFKLIVVDTESNIQIDSFETEEDAYDEAVVANQQWCQALVLDENEFNTLKKKLNE